MSIWYSEFTLEQLQKFVQNTLFDHLGIEFIEIGEDYLKATMPVDHRTKQPYGLLHGGSNAALAESLASIAATLTVDYQKQFAVGVELNVNHLRPVREGKVTGVARPIKLGKTVHVWDIQIFNDAGELSAVSRLTLMIVSQKT